MYRILVESASNYLPVYGFIEIKLNFCKLNCFNLSVLRVVADKLI